MIRRLIVMLLLSAIPAGAVCHVVRPVGSGGSNNGNDWTNAFLGLPTTLVRGDSYFLADGTYSAYNFTTATSGTTIITIKKAISSDHCTDTGYNNGTMGSAQAVFSTGSGFIWQFNSSSFWTIDGQSRTSLKGGHGIKLDNSGKNGATQGFAINFSGTSSTHVTDITIRYVEIAGGGVGNSADSFSITAISRTSNVATVTYSASHSFLADSSTVVGSQIAVSGVADASFNTANSRVTAATATTASYANTGADASSSGGTIAGALNLSEFDYRFAGCVDNLVLNHSYIHDSSDTPFQGDGTFGLGCSPGGITLEFSDIARNNSNATRHSEALATNDINCDSSCTSTSNSINVNGKLISRFNVWEDAEGTGFLVCIGQCRNIEVYGDVYMWHQGNTYHRSGVGNGVITSTSSAKNATGWKVYNTTFVNTGDNTGLSAGQIITMSNCGVNCGPVDAQNNLCYFPTGTNCGYGLNVTHDWTFCSTTGTCNSETHLQTGSGTPLVDWVNENYHLSAATNAGNTLASPYNTDPDGLTRGADGTWDRGAFEFGSSSCSPVISSVTVNPTSVVGGNTSTGTATISCAPSIDTAVSLSSSNTAVATVPATVTVLANQTTANFTVTTNAVCVSTNVTITASLNGTTTAALTVTPGAAQCHGASIIGTAIAIGTSIIQ